ncbi:MAG: methenyltetrahydromethanopterin cyclohydrolase, partial [Planctomycetaceae bacterium]
MSLNAAAHGIARQLAARAAALGCEVLETAGVRVVDCGVRAGGGIDAGILMARAALSTRQPAHWAAIGREPLYDVIGMREHPAAAVGVLESARRPPAEACLRLAADAGVEPQALTLLVARTASPAGTVQVAARALETALH